MKIGDKIRLVLAKNPSIEENRRVIKGMAYLAKKDPRHYEMKCSGKHAALRYKRDILGQSSTQINSIYLWSLNDYNDDGTRKSYSL